MKVEPLASVKAHLSALLDEVVRTHEQYTVTRNGQPVAVILAADDYESLMETIALLSDQPAMERLAEAERAVSEGDLTTDAEMAAILAAASGRRERPVRAPHRPARPTRPRARAAPQDRPGGLGVPRRSAAGQPPGGRPFPTGAVRRLWSARRGTYRIRCRIDEERRLVLVLDIAGRGDAYDPTRR